MVKAHKKIYTCCFQVSNVNIYNNVKKFFQKFDCIHVSNVVFSRAEGSNILSSKSGMQNFQNNKLKLCKYWSI